MRRRLLIPLPAALLVLVGCGTATSDSPSPDASIGDPQAAPTTIDPSSLSTSEATGKAFTGQLPGDIRDQAVAATLASGGFRVRGTYVSNGAHESLDIRVNADGDCTGSFGVGPARAEVLGVGGQYWFRPDDAFWRLAVGDHAAAASAAAAGRWVSNPALATTCDPAQLFASTDATGVGKGRSDVRHTVRGLTRLQGRQVLKVGASNDTGSATAYVLTRVPHVIVELRRSGTQQAHLYFDDFGQTIDPAAPAPDQQVTLDQLDD